jgi:hypothetical protein
MRYEILKTIDLTAPLRASSGSRPQTPGDILTPPPPPNTAARPLSPPVAHRYASRAESAVYNERLSFGVNERWTRGPTAQRPAPLDLATDAGAAAMLQCAHRRQAARREMASRRAATITIEKHVRGCLARIRRGSLDPRRIIVEQDRLRFLDGDENDGKGGGWRRGGHEDDTDDPFQHTWLDRRCDSRGSSSRGGLFSGGGAMPTASSPPSTSAARGALAFEADAMAVSIYARRRRRAERQQPARTSPQWLLAPPTPTASTSTSTSISMSTSCMALGSLLPRAAAATSATGRLLTAQEGRMLKPSMDAVCALSRPKVTQRLLDRARGDALHREAVQREATAWRRIQEWQTRETGVRPPQPHFAVRLSTPAAAPGQAPSPMVQLGARLAHAPQIRTGSSTHAPAATTKNAPALLSPLQLGKLTYATHAWAHSHASDGPTISPRRTGQSHTSRATSGDGAHDCLHAAAVSPRVQLAGGRVVGGGHVGGSGSSTASPRGHRPAHASFVSIRSAGACSAVEAAGGPVCIPGPVPPPSARSMMTPSPRSAHQGHH